MTSPAAGSEPDELTPWVRWLRQRAQPRATVVLVAGLAGMTEDWSDVVSLLSPEVSVLAIEPTRCPLPPTLAGRMEMLSAASAEIARPAIWVAHSMAVFAVEAAAITARIRCDGMVFVDPSVPEEAPSRRRATRSSGDLPLAGMAVAGLLDRYGHRVSPATGVLGPLGRRLSVRLLARRADPRRSEEIRSMYGDPRVLAIALTELDAFSSQARDLARLREQLPRPTLPWLTLLADRRRFGYREGPGEVVQLVQGTGHLIMIERPDVVVTAIDAVLDRTR